MLGSMGWRGGGEEEQKRLRFQDKFLIVLKKRGSTYTVLGDADHVTELYRKEIEPEKVLVANEVFTDIQNGVKASNAELKELAVDKIAKETRKRSPKERRRISEQVEKMGINQIKKDAAIYIAANGGIKLPKKVRDDLLQEKKTKLLQYLKKYAVNPATNNPYPPRKVEEVFEDAAPQLEIDPLEQAETQIPRIVDAISERLPLKLEILTVKVTIPAQYTGKAYSEVKKLGEMQETNWMNDGSLEAQIRIPGGQYIRVKRILNDISRGRTQTEIVDRESF